IGGGQSAIETAAFLAESGTETHVASRRPILWLDKAPATVHRSLRHRILHQRAAISSDWPSWALEHLPYAFRQLPHSMKDRLLRLYGPAASSWLRPRVIGKQWSRTLPAVRAGLDLFGGHAKPAVRPGFAVMVEKSHAKRRDIQGGSVMPGPVPPAV